MRNLLKTFKMSRKIRRIIIWNKKGGNRLPFLSIPTFRFVFSRKMQYQLKNLYQWYIYSSEWRYFEFLSHHSANTFFFTITMCCSKVDVFIFHNWSHLPFYHIIHGNNCGIKILLNNDVMYLHPHLLSFAWKLEIRTRVEHYKNMNADA